ncbi:MAG: DPP IV N-terminal domain-containing protein, partial [Verrucomicrobiia bacterium]
MKKLSVGLFLGLIVLLSCARADSTPEAPQQRPPPGQRDTRVFKDRIRPYWFANNTRFWYRNDLPHGAREFVMVDAQRGVRQQAFDHARLAAALSRDTGKEYRADQLPFDTIEFVAGATAIKFTVDDLVWQCDLNSYQLTKQEPASTAVENSDHDRDSRATPYRRRSRGQRQQGDSPQSPDGQWTAFVRDHNVFVRANDDSGREIQLSRDGREGLSYGHISWSPSSKALVAFRIEPGDRKEVYLIESSPQGGGRARLHSRPYALPGDKFPTYEVNVFDIASTNHIKPEVDRFEHEWLRPELHWSRDNQRFAYQQVDRGHQRLRVIEVDT